jgi:hypothetical protein
MSESAKYLHHANGAALAAVLGAAIGSAALGVVVLLHEAGIWSAPTIWPPGAGALSGRVGIGVLAWLVAWFVLARRWRGQERPVGKITAWSLGLVLFAILATFPPVWGLL